MIYLASPYSHRDPAVRQHRFDAVCRVAAELIRHGAVVYSPIVHGHPLCRYDLPTDWAFWQEYDLAFLKKCDRIVVLRLDGWQESVGVRAEVEAAARLGKLVNYLDAPQQADAA
jgi:hypothetical protein